MENTAEHHSGVDHQEIGRMMHVVLEPMLIVFGTIGNLLDILRYEERLTERCIHRRI